MIDLKNKTLFIHIPRTGGSEFCNQYYNYILSTNIDVDHYNDYLVGHGAASKHFTYGQYAQFYQFTNLAEFNLVSIIRNIYELVVSSYFQRIQPGEEDHGFFNWSRNHQQDPSMFSTWVEYLIDKADEWESTGRPQGLTSKTPYVSMLQTEFLAGHHADCCLIPYEEFDTGVNEWFSTVLDVDTNIKSRTGKRLQKYYNESKYFIPRPVNYKDMYDDRTLSQIRDLFEDEISMFDFKI